MAGKKPNSTALEADAGNAIPRLSLGETGYQGLKISNHQIYAERNKVFRWPNIINVEAEMSADATVSTAIGVYTQMLNSVPWFVKPPADADETEKARAEFAASCMEDMEHSWESFMKEVTTNVRFGFSVQEIVLRRRTKKNGSKHNDGKVGIRKLAPRSQDTICKWYFSEDGRTLEAVGQSLHNLENNWRFVNLMNEDGVLKIDREKVLIFSVDSTNGNPLGRSMLKSVFLPYKQLSLLKDQLMLGIAKDLQGIPCIGIPSDLLKPDATPDEKRAAQQFIDMANNLVKGTQSGIVYPLMYDESGKPTVEIKLLEAKYGKSFDIPAVIEMLKTEILTALNVDVVQLGNAGQGSYSLASSKENLLAMAVEYRLKEIRSVLNNHLMRIIYEQNGWNTDRMATFEFGDIVDADLETLSKFYQRTKAVNALPRNHDTVNKLLKALDLPLIPEDVPLDDLFPEEMQSRAGDGMEKGMGNGTSDKPASKNKSDDNADNAA